MGAHAIFGGATSDFIRYRVELAVREKLVGGIPKDAATIKKWLTARLEMEDRAIIELAEETAAAMTAAAGRPSADELVDAIATQVSSGNGFKTVDGELVYEGRCMKAALKESANVAFPGNDWPGKPAGIRKGLMRYLAERVFVENDYIPLGVSRPSATEERIKHIITPQGPRSAINVVDVVDKPRLSFTVAVLDDFLPQSAWGRLWEVAEEIGIGADRARSDGRFELLVWERIDTEPPAKKRTRSA